MEILFKKFKIILRFLIENKRDIFDGYGLTSFGTSIIIKQCILGCLGRADYSPYPILSPHRIPYRGICVLVTEEGEQLNLT